MNQKSTVTARVSTDPALQVQQARKNFIMRPNTVRASRSAQMKGLI